MKGEFPARVNEIEIAFEKLVNKDEFVHKCEKWLEESVLAEKVEVSKLSQIINFLH